MKKLPPSSPSVTLSESVNPPHALQSHSGKPTPSHHVADKASEGTKIRAEALSGTALSAIAIGNPTNRPVLLTRAELRRVGIPLSNTQLIRLERAGIFPKRLFTSPARVAWIASEVFEYLEARAAEREGRKYGDY